MPRTLDYIYFCQSTPCQLRQVSVMVMQMQLGLTAEAQIVCLFLTLHLQIECLSLLSIVDLSMYEYVTLISLLPERTNCWDFTFSALNIYFITLTNLSFLLVIFSSILQLPRKEE